MEERKTKRERRQSIIFSHEALESISTHRELKESFNRAVNRMLVGYDTYSREVDELIEAARAAGIADMTKEEREEMASEGSLARTIRFSRAVMETIKPMQGDEETFNGLVNRLLLAGAAAGDGEVLHIGTGTIDPEAFEAAMKSSHVTVMPDEGANATPARYAKLEEACQAQRRDMSEVLEKVTDYVWRGLM